MLLPVMVERSAAGCSSRSGSSPPAGCRRPSRRSAASASAWSRSTNISGSTASSLTQSSNGGVSPKTSSARSLSSSHVPLLGIGIGRDRLADQRVDRLGAHVLDDVADRLGVHDVGALLVDHLALVVHDVVIFDDLLADVVVARLDLLLRGLDRLGDPGRDDRLAVGEILVHQPREHGLRAEDAQQIVVEATDRSGDRPGSPWRPERPRSWLSMRRLSWRSVPSTNRPPAAITLSFSSATSRRIFSIAASRFGPGLHLAELVLDAEVDIAAELDVGAAAGHVGGDGDRAEAARLGDDMRLLLVIAGVQHLVLDLRLLEIFGEQLRLLDRDGADQDRLADVLLLLDRLDDRAELVVLVLVEFVVVVGAPDRQVGRDR